MRVIKSLRQIIPGIFLQRRKTLHNGYDYSKQWASHRHVRTHVLSRMGHWAVGLGIRLLLGNREMEKDW